MSMYSTPRSPPIADSGGGPTLPATIMRIREGKNGGSSGEFSGVGGSRDSPKSKPMTSPGGLRQMRQQGDLDLAPKAAQTQAHERGSPLAGIGNTSVSQLASFSRISDEPKDGGHRSFRRGSASRFGRGGTSTIRQVNRTSMHIWSLWAVIAAGLSVSFILVYYLQTVSEEQEKNSLAVAESAVVVSAAFLDPLLRYLQSFNASIGSNLIQSSADFAYVSSITFPLFAQFTYVEQAEFVFTFSINETLRVRPPAGASRIVPCKVHLESVTNLHDIPTVYTQEGEACSERENFCQFGLACEGGDYSSEDIAWSMDLVAVAMSGPFLYSPPESPTQQILSLSLASPGDVATRIVVSLGPLSAALLTAYPENLIFVTNENAEFIGTSKPSEFDLIGVSDGSLVVSPSLHDLDPHEYPWVHLLPDTLELGGAYADSETGWEIRVKPIPLFGGQFVLVVSNRSEFVDTALFPLGITSITISLLPSVYIAYLLIGGAVSALRFYYRR